MPEDGATMPFPGPFPTALASVAQINFSRDPVDGKRITPPPRPALMGCLTALALDIMKSPWQLAKLTEMED